MSSTPPPFVRGFEKNRLEALIDGIFAVALTVVAFYSTHFSLYVYMVLICAHFFPGRIDGHIHTTQGALSSKDP
jgi:hypothetical protein